MYEFASDEILDRLSEVKSVAVSISRSTDRLLGRRLPAEQRVAPQSPLLIRQIVSHVVARCRHEAPDETARRLYPGSDMALSTKAATNPATSTTAGFAAELAMPAVANILPVLAPMSGYAQLVPRGVRVNLAGRGSVKLPKRTAGVLPVKFVAEAAPIPVGAAGLANVTLVPHKVGAISFFTEELANRSTPTIESIIRQALAEDTGTYLDSIMFGSAAESATQPPGLFNGVVASTGLAGGGQAAVAKDIGTLIDAIAPAASPVLVANASTAARLSVWAPALALPVIVSEAMADNALGALDSAAVASGEGDSFTITTGVDAVLHGEDTTPLPIASTGSPNTIAAPSQSFFQSDLVALRLTAFATWAMRASNKASLITSVTW